MKTQPTRVLFVCLGNICRSPMAEAVFRQMVHEAGLHHQIHIDSAGTSAWHLDEPPHQGTIGILRRHGIQTNHRARQVNRDDFIDYDYLIAMDEDNLYNLRSRLQGSSAKLHLLLEFAPDAGRHEVPDPYYTGRFDETYHLVVAGCRGLLNTIMAERA